MHRLLLPITLALLMVLPARGQAVSDAEARRMIAEVNRVAATVHRVESDFVQVRQSTLLAADATSQGHFVYTDQQQLRWEYREPYHYLLTIDGEAINIHSDTQDQSIDMQRSATARRIAQFVMRGATGQLLDDGKNFTVAMHIADGGLWVARLTPRQSRLRRLFTLVELTFDPKQQMMTAVALHERSGDTTVITLQNIKVNAKP